VEFPDFLGSPFVSDLPAAGWPACGRQGENYMCAVGVPIEGEQGGESQPFRGWKGQVFTFLSSPERVTAEAVKRRDKGIHLKNPILSMKS